MANIGNKNNSKHHSTSQLLYFFLYKSFEISFELMSNKTQTSKTSKKVEMLKKNSEIYQNLQFYFIIFSLIKIIVGIKGGKPLTTTENSVI